MIIHKNTTSICPVCFKEIPATIQVSNQSVQMIKTCPEHGETSALVEKDPVFYMLNEVFNASNIYNALLVDVTYRCNTKCKYCYFVKSNNPDPSIREIVDYCSDNSTLAPFVLGGGEPTCRGDLPELCRELRKVGPVTLLTNGLRLSDKEYVDSLDALVWPEYNVMCVSISLNPKEHNTAEDYTKKIQAIENVLSTGLNLHGIVLVIDQLEQIDELIEINRKYPGRIKQSRIKIAGSLGSGKTAIGIFASDVYNYLYNKALTERVPFQIDTSQDNKVTYFNVIYDGIYIPIVKWYEANNIDLNDINCPPYHKGKDGILRNMVYSQILG